MALCEEGPKVFNVSVGFPEAISPLNHRVSRIHHDVGNLMIPECSLHGFHGCVVQKLLRVADLIPDIWPCTHISNVNVERAASYLGHLIGFFFPPHCHLYLDWGLRTHHQLLKTKKQTDIRWFFVKISVLIFHACTNECLYEKNVFEICSNHSHNNIRLKFY